MFRKHGLERVLGHARLLGADVLHVEAQDSRELREEVDVAAGRDELLHVAVRDRVKAVLNPGSNLEIAAADFDSSEQFVTTAHAARNTKVPFVLLKDRVLNQGQSLAEAIREFKPELDARAEVQRARTAARSDLEIAG